MNSPKPGSPSAEVSTVSPEWTWNEMIERFRTLGGTIDNIVQGDGPFGRGLFPADRDKPVLLHVPPNLLVPCDDIKFENDRVKVRSTSRVERAEREFFEKYQNTFSWGGRGRTDALAFFARMDALPKNVRELLSREFGFKEIFQGSGNARIQKRFIESRHVTWNGRLVSMPLVELLNHGPDAPPFGMGENGISVKGRFGAEILARYAWDDPFGIFTGWGFVSAEQQAFSLPLKLDLGQRQLRIGRDIQVAAKRGDIRFPSLNQVDKDFVLSYLMIGHEGYPRLSKAIFYRLMTENGLTDAEALFDEILHFNRTKFLKLLAALEPHDGESIMMLRTIVRLQLEAMSKCIGTREILT